jgi:hypothetical protein
MMQLAADEKSYVENRTEECTLAQGNQILSRAKVDLLGSATNGVGCTGPCLLFLARPPTSGGAPHYLA